MRLGILNGQQYLEHRCGTFDHPDRPERLLAAVRAIKSTGLWQRAVHVEPRPATPEELQLAHHEKYVQDVLRILDQGDFGNLDMDTFFSPGSRQAALDAVGGGIDLASAVHKREIDWGFAIVRPPGHHATWNRAKGFCIFNNIAVASRSLIETGLAKKVAIIDWDVHHGNGTQDQFWDDPNVLYISLHQWPFYPGSGALQEQGGPAARGKNVNVPLLARARDADYHLAFHKVVVPLLTTFEPDHIFVSAGFDAHRRDPLANMLLTSTCFGQMARMVKDLADRLCEGRLTLFLEGGYELEILEESIIATIKGISGKVDAPPQPTFDETRSQHLVISNLISSLHAFWPSGLN